MKKQLVKHLWIILGAYGVWFALFSGFEEVARGKYWKVIASLACGFIIFIVTELVIFKKD